MFINEVKREGYTCFNSIEDKRERNKQINSLKYIDELASMSRTDIREWNLVEVFADDKGIFPVNRNRINKIFFQCKAGFVPKEYEMSGPMMAKLKGLEESIPTRDMSRVDRDIASERETVASYQRNLDEVMSRLRKKIDFKNILIGHKLDMPEMVKKVIDENFWTLHEIEDSTLVFHTKNDVYIKYKNDAQMVDLNVNTGRFECRYNITRGRAPVTGLENNIVSHTLHPHVGSGGGVCTGDMSDQFNQAKMYRMIDQVMNIIQCSLTTYNHDSPYIAIEALHQARVDQEMSEERRREELKMIAEMQRLEDRLEGERNGQEEAQGQVEGDEADSVRHIHEPGHYRIQAQSGGQDETTSSQ